MDDHSDDIRRPLSPRIEVYAGAGRKHWPDDLKAQIVAESAQLYAVEKALRGRSDAERRAGRQAHAQPLAAALKQWFEATLDHLAQKSDTAKALRYALRHWDGLTLYLDDGRIEMDTNAVERAMGRSSSTPRTPFLRLRRGRRELGSTSFVNRDL